MITTHQAEMIINENKYGHCIENYIDYMNSHLHYIEKYFIDEISKSTKHKINIKYEYCSSRILQFRKIRHLKSYMLIPFQEMISKGWKIKVYLKRKGFIIKLSN